MGKKRHPYNDNKIAVAYYRYSSSSQNEASIEQQREQAHRWADSQGLTIAFEYDDYARTGRNMKRPGLLKMLGELDTIKPAYLIAWKNDRLGRDRADLMAIKRQVRDAGVRIHYIHGTDPGEGPTRSSSRQSLMASRSTTRSICRTTSPVASSSTRSGAWRVGARSSATWWARTSATSRTRRRRRS